MLAQVITVALITITFAYFAYNWATKYSNVDTSVGDSEMEKKVEDKY